MQHAELRRLSADVPKNPDLLFGILERNGNTGEIISFVKSKGYDISQSDVDEIINNSSETVSMARERVEGGPSPVIAIVVVVVAVWVYVV